MNVYTVLGSCASACSRDPWSGVGGRIHDGRPDVGTGHVAWISEYPDREVF